VHAFVSEGERTREKEGMHHPVPHELSATLDFLKTLRLEALTAGREGGWKDSAPGAGLGMNVRGLGSKGGCECPMCMPCKACWQPGHCAQVASTGFVQPGQETQNSVSLGYTYVKVAGYSWSICELLKRCQ